MNNESTCHQPSTLTVDSLTYKELQSLAMSLSLPGKMKQGVLVEAIKARQNNNEEAVTMILEANRQRRLLKRQQHQRSQQQQLLKLKEVSEKDVGGNNTDNQANCLTHSKMKRSASEMEMDPTDIVDEEIYKRSKLAAALIQQPRQQSRQQSRGFSFTSFTTGAASITIRKENQYQTIMGGCSTWEHQQQTVMSPVVGLPSQSHPMMQQKGLPVLSKELSILPVLSDCSHNGGSGANSTNNENLCCSVGSVSATSTSSCWKSGVGAGDNSLPLPQSSFESCDSGWMRADDSYDLNTLHNIKLSNNNSFESMVPPPSLHTPPNSSSGYFDATVTAASDTSISSGEIYIPDDFTSANNNNNNSSSVTAAGSNFNADYPLPLESSNSFHDVNIKPDTSSWCESFAQQTQSFQQQPQSQSKSQQSSMQNGSNHNGPAICFAMPGEPHVTAKNCPYDFDCYRLGGPFFRIQRPGNPTSVVVTSGRGTTLTTFCNMLPRTASYIQ